MNFTINEDYLISVTKKEEVVVLNARGEFEVWTSSETVDHDEFTALREQLGADGFIAIERSWVNGDRVLKPFSVNGLEFKESDTFPCAPALKNEIEFERDKDPAGFDE